MLLQQLGRARTDELSITRSCLVLFEGGTCYTGLGSDSNACSLTTVYPHLNRTTHYICWLVQVEVRWSRLHAHHSRDSQNVCCQHPSAGISSPPTSPTHPSPSPTPPQSTSPLRTAVQFYAEPTSISRNNSAIFKPTFRTFLCITISRGGPNAHGFIPASFLVPDPRCGCAGRCCRLWRSSRSGRLDAGYLTAARISTRPPCTSTKKSARTGCVHSHQKFQLPAKYGAGECAQEFVFTIHPLISPTVDPLFSVSGVANDS